MEYRLLQHSATSEVCAVREDGMATTMLSNAQYRDDDTPEAAIRVDWAADQDYAIEQPNLWDNDNYIVLASDKDPLGAVVDQPQSLNPADGGDAGPEGA